MSDKDFKVKNKLVLNGLTQTGPLVADANKQVDATPYLTTLQGGTGTTTSPAAGQVLYSASGTTYAPATLNTLDVKGATYSADAPASPFVGQVWIESDSSSDSFDPNIIRRKSFTATAGQTTFTADLEFIQGYEQVFFNGMLLVRNNDYTTPTNTSVVLTTAAAVNDIVEIVSITNLNSINTVATTGANTITSTTASTIPLTIQGAASQTADLFRLINNSNQILANHNGSTLNLKTITFPALSLTRYGTTGASAGIDFMKSDGVTLDNNVAVALDSKLFDMRSIGYDGSAYGAVATSISGWVDGAVSTGLVPGRLVFSTTGVERMRINSSGNIGIGTSSPAAKLDVNGSINASNLYMAGKNILINGAFDFWQRGTSFTNPAPAYTADRWGCYRGGYASGALVTRQSVTPSDVGGAARYCARVQRTSGDTSTQAIAFQQNIEDIFASLISGQTVTFSFWARKGSDYSASSSLIIARADFGTADYSQGGGGGASSNPLNSTATLTTSWQKFSFTFVPTSGKTTAALNINYVPTGTAGANDWFEVTGVQLEVGSTATPFSRAGGTIAGELAACQRYYYRVDSANAADGRMNTVNVVAGSTTLAYGNFAFPVRMRISPSFSSSTATGWALGRIGTILSALGQERSSQYSSMIRTTVSSGLTGGNGDWLEVRDSNTAYIEFNAEF